MLTDIPQVTEEDFDILRHLQKAESLVTTYAIQELVNVTDQLYHALYARITLEIAHTHLCSEFPLERTRTPSIDFFFMLPEAHHLCRIFRAFKEIMDCPSVCSVLNRELVNKHQADILLKAIDYVDVHGFSLDDMLGYRAFMRNYLRPRHNPFYSKYGRFRQIYTMPPVKVLIFASEKFLSISPRDMVKDDMPSSELPFINMKSLNPRYWEKEIMLDHRLAALAKLEGKAIGQLRREQHDAGDPLVEFAQERKCICPAVCCCAMDCTNDVERACPCAERMLRIELAKRSREVSSQVFGARCANFARLIFETLAYIDRDVDGCDIVQEILSSIELIEQEVDKERRQRVQAALACSSESE